MSIPKKQNNAIDTNRIDTASPRQSHYTNKESVMTNITSNYMSPSNRTVHFPSLKYKKVKC